MFNKMILLFVLLGGFSVSVVQQVSGISIYTASDLEAVNGTDVRLKCIFRSSVPVTLHSVSVFWFFRPLHPGREESVFYYRQKPYPPTGRRFRDRVVWSGNVLEKDASITLQQVDPTFNGTYICRVLNLPDVRGSNGEIRLRVVETSRFDWIMALFNMTGAGV